MSTQIIRISQVASKYLATWLDQLLRGELELWQLPPALQQWHHAGFSEGYALNPDRQQIARLEHECDQLYLAAFSPKDRREELLRRLDQHFELEAAAFYAVEVEPINEYTTQRGANASPQDPRAVHRAVHAA